MSDFDIIRQRAEQRKGGADALKAMRRPCLIHEALRALPDDRILSQMTRRIFYSGFVHKVIDNKWQGFEEAFDGFDPAALNIAPDEFWHGLTGDDRIVKNGAKISVGTRQCGLRARACERGRQRRRLLRRLARVGIISELLELLTQRGSRLGGATGEYFLRGMWPRQLHHDIRCARLPEGCGRAAFAIRDRQEGSAVDPADGSTAGPMKRGCRSPISRASAAGFRSTRPKNAEISGRAVF